MGLKQNAQNLSPVRKSLDLRWEEKLADELHKPIKHNFKKRRVIVNNVDDIWCSDLELFSGRINPKSYGLTKEKEYYNKNVKDLLAKNNIEIYSTENEEKSSVCERCNRTIKEKMYKRFTIQNNTV